MPIALKQKKSNFEIQNESIFIFSGFIFTKYQQRWSLHTCATKGVIREPNRDIALEVPIPKALVSVGNT